MVSDCTVISMVLTVVTLWTAATGENQVAVSQSNTCVSNDTEVYCWGRGKYGTLGTGSDTDLLLPPTSPIDFGDNFFVDAIDCGDDHCCGVSTVGTLKCWGGNWNGQLGQGNADWWIGASTFEMGDDLSIIDLGSEFKVYSVSCGATHTCVLSTNETIKCFGSNGNGQLGYGHTENLGDEVHEMGENLATIDLGTNFIPIQVDCGEHFSCALSATFKVKCWGWNSDGQLGQGDTENRGDDINEMGINLTVIDLGTAFNVSRIHCGELHVCAMSTMYSMKCWGRNSNGQLGLGDTDDRGVGQNEMGDYLPVLDFGTNFVPVLMGGGHSHNLVFSSNGTLKAWGLNSHGQLGYGDTDNRGDHEYVMVDDLSVVEIGIGFTVTNIASGCYNHHSCVLLENGTDSMKLKCWGRNLYGQLGLNDTENRGAEPNEMGTDLSFVSISLRIPPTVSPTTSPTLEPTVSTQPPSSMPTWEPTESPSSVPTVNPTFVPSAESTMEPTKIPSNEPTNDPTHGPTMTAPCHDATYQGSMICYDQECDALRSGESMVSLDCQYKLTMEDSGDLVLYEASDSRRRLLTWWNSTWSTNTRVITGEPKFTLFRNEHSSGIAITEVKMDSDTEVELDRLWSEVFESNGENLTLTLSQNGTIILYDDDGSLWTADASANANDIPSANTDGDKENTQHSTSSLQNLYLILIIGVGGFSLCVLMALIVVCYSQRKLANEIANVGAKEMTNGLIVSIPIGHYYNSRKSDISANANEESDISANVSIPDLPVQSDAQNMRNLADYLNYKYMTIDGKLQWTEREIMDFMKNNVGNEYFDTGGNPKYDGLIVSFSGHGVRNHIVSSDGKLIDRTSIHRCVSNAFPKIREFPRIFIFDACDGAGDRRKTITEIPNIESVDSQSVEIIYEEKQKGDTQRQSEVQKRTGIRGLCLKENIL